MNYKTLSFLIQNHSAEEKPGALAKRLPLQDAETQTDEHYKKPFFQSQKSEKIKKMFFAAESRLDKLDSNVRRLSEVLRKSKGSSSLVEAKVKQIAEKMHELSEINFEDLANLPKTFTENYSSIRKATDKSHEKGEQGAGLRPDFQTNSVDINHILSNLNQSRYSDRHGLEDYFRDMSRFLLTFRKRVDFLLASLKEGAKLKSRTGRLTFRGKRGKPTPPAEKNRHFDEKILQAKRGLPKPVEYVFDEQPAARFPEEQNQQRLQAEHRDNSKRKFAA